MPTILIVDDDPDIRRVLRALFERAGYRVSEAGTAAQALRSVMGAELPDAVVCDVLMPGPSGLDFYDELARVAPTLKNRVVFLTGASQDPKVHNSIEEAGVPLLAKLDDLRLVVDAIRIALLRPR
jgi:CheY-like chemotaxis protein